MLRAAMRAPRALVAAASLLIMTSESACTQQGSDPPPSRAEGPSVTRAAFGSTPDGTAVELFTFRNAAGLEVRAMSYGAIILSLRVPDRRGQLDDVVLGYDTAAEYVTNKTTYFGALVGRYANRIAKARFTLNGRTYPLATNDGPNHLHGGKKGFDTRHWRGETVQDDRGVGVAFTYTSPDGEEGYPGTLKARIAYTLTDKNELVFDFHATTDAATIVNLAQHSYFNLAGQGTRDVLDHELQIFADRYTPVDDTLIPTGELATVDGTPFDFKSPMKIGARIDQDNTQLRRGRGYDHNWVLTRSGEGLQPAVKVIERSTGRTMQISTTEPGLQFYSGNFLDGSNTGKQGHVYRHRSGFCLETQHYPDSPNKPDFPSTALRPGQEYRSRTVLTFGTEP
jgi:aldose 1-epimerase